MSRLLLLPLIVITHVVHVLTLVFRCGFSYTLYIAPRAHDDIIAIVAEDEERV